VRRPEPGPVSTEAEAKDLLRAWGLPVVPGAVAADPEAAVAAAERLGYPVVLKVIARDLAHKSEVGGVLLDLRAADAVRAGWQQVLAASPDAEGVLVERYRPGVELVLGCVHDPVFGPVVALGLGGVLAEALDDVAVAPAPVTPAGAARMVERLRGRVLLEGFRGQRPADLPALHHLVARLSERFAAAAGQLAEVEINPLVAGADGWLAVDALVRRG
jgi:succinyl-CoA synthetase beta subunit